MFLRKKPTLDIFSVLGNAYFTLPLNGFGGCNLWLTEQESEKRKGEGEGGG